jgi:hypothetical protein
MLLCFVKAFYELDTRRVCFLLRGGHDREGPLLAEGEVGLRARFGVAAVRLPQAPSRTRRAPFRAPGAPRVFPAGQPVLAAAGAGVQGVGMLLPR